MLTILRNIICRWWWVGTVLLSALTVYAADGSVDVQLYAPSGDVKSAVISRQGLVRLKLVKGEAAGSATLTLKEFADADANPVAVMFQVGEHRDHTQTVTLDEEPTLLTLFVEGAKPGVAYSGELWVKIVNSPPIQSFTFSLMRPLPKNYPAVPTDALKLSVPVSDLGVVRFHLVSRPKNFEWFSGNVFST
jgi:hypothetical protein